jgi:uncharacterized protein YeeX (DUF496 family)
MDINKIVKQASKKVKFLNLKTSFLVDCCGYSEQEVGEMDIDTIQTIIEQNINDYQNWVNSTK